MNKPSVVTMDANACIQHALDLGKSSSGRPVHSYECKFVRCFVDGCLREEIRIGAFPTAENHSWRNISRAVNRLASERGFGKEHYEKRKFYEFAVVNLKKLFKKIEEFPENYTESEVDGARRFFESIAKSVALHSSPDKSPIPEEHDLEMFVSTHNLTNDTVHIVSYDSHFVEYASEIEISAYSVGVIPGPNLGPIVAGWDWPISG